METEGGAQRVNCANTEGLFRIIQSIPAPRAEPFKRWLAFCATVGQMTEEMIDQYFEHYFEPRPNDDFKMEPDY